MICMNCGNDFPNTHKHHVWGRKNSQETVELCPNCHSEHHSGLLLFECSFTKRSVELFEKEVNELESKRFVGVNEKKRILEKHGYYKSLRELNKSVAKQGRAR